MGLDMYMRVNSKRVARNGQSVMDEAERKFYGNRDTAIYWRKANAVHRWIVINVGRYEDFDEYDGRDLDVDVRDLKRLRDDCQRVLDSCGGLVESEAWFAEGVGGKVVKVKKTVLLVKDNTLARELLPVQEGFFFGDQAYGANYLKDLEYTVKAIDATLQGVVKDETGLDWHWVHEDETDWLLRFTYYASW